MRLRFSILLLLLLAPLARAGDFQADFSAWRSERIARLTAPDSWLSLVGLHWMKPGLNLVGSAADADLRLASGPPYFGTLKLAADGKVFFLAAPASQVTVDGAETGERLTELRYGSGKPSLVAAHTVSFVVIKRGEKIGVRVRDSESPRRVNFVGIVTFDLDPSWRIEADWVAFAQPRMIPITNVLGQTTPMPAPGKAVFQRDGKTYELIPILEGGPEEPLFFILADETSGVETYEASRFLYAEPARNGKVILDFNRAQNPPCAFTPFATCPLPPKENRLKLRITAGEKIYRGEHH